MCLGFIRHIETPPSNFHDEVVSCTTHCVRNAWQFIDEHHWLHLFQSSFPPSTAQTQGLSHYGEMHPVTAISQDNLMYRDNCIKLRNPWWIVELDQLESQVEWSRNNSSAQAEEFRMSGCAPTKHDMFPMHNNVKPAVCNRDIYSFCSLLDQLRIARPSVRIPLFGGGDRIANIRHNAFVSLMCLPIQKTFNGVRQNRHPKQRNGISIIRFN